MSSRPIQLFISYSHEDEGLRRELVNHLRPLERDDVVSSWSDRKIPSGSTWKGEIDARLDSADVILLLVSSDFIASDYCIEVETQRAMERHARGEARVIPVILRACDWSRMPFGALQALPPHGQPVTSPYWSSTDEALTAVTRGVWKAAADHGLVHDDGGTYEEAENEGVDSPHGLGGRRPLLDAFGRLFGIAGSAPPTRLSLEVEQFLQAEHGVQHLQPRRILTVPGFDIHGTIAPGELPGGDFYDLVQRPCGRVAFVVGDVVGFGLESILTGVTARAMLRVLLRRKAPLEEIMNELATNLRDELEIGQFVTVLLGELDPDSRTIRLVRAGHEPPLHYRNATRTWSPIESHGMAIGIVPDYMYEAGAEVRLDPGDMLLAHTDGLVEVRAVNGSYFGTRRVMEILEQNRSHAAEKGVRDLVSAARSFVGSERLHDDVTVVLVRAP